MTKEEVLQKVNDYCTEKQYTTATLTDAFKDKFADHFQRANPEGDISDEGVLANLKFALNTAFSSASELATVKNTEFTTKENVYKSQIVELKKKIPANQQQQQFQQQQFEIPQEIKDQLEELKQYKNARSKQEKFENILKLAKQGVRDDLHGTLENYARDYDVKLDKEDKEQADALVARFKDIFKDSLGDIRPQKPVTTQKQVEDVIGSIPKIKVSN
jgi:hypothetical protein